MIKIDIHGDKEAHELRFEHFGRSVLGVAEVDDIVEELGARVTITLRVWME